MKSLFVKLSLLWKHFDIVKQVDGKPTLYLRRWFIWRCKYFNVFLHYIPQPDNDRDPHDHPWTFVSLLLSGGYIEKVFNAVREEVATNYRLAPSIGYRPGETVHYITHVDPMTVTLVFTSNYFREWGFITSNGWVDWRKYLGIAEDTKVEMD